MSVDVVERIRLNENDWLFGQTARDARMEITALREQVEESKTTEAIAAMKLGEALIKIGYLEEQVEKLTKERDAAWSVNPTVSENLLREQLAALAEQNEKMREAITEARGWNWLDDDVPTEIVKQIDVALDLPDLASPVLNRVRAEGMRMAAEICARLTAPTKLSDPWRSWINGTLDCEKAIRARAAELENEDAN